MSGNEREDRSWVHTHLRPVLRFGSAGLLLVPGASKLVTYGRSVRFFESLSIPSPELLVPVVGLLELGAALLFVLDRAVWAGALVAAPIMVVAAMTAGPTWQNLGVLGAAIALAGLEHPRVRSDR